MKKSKTIIGVIGFLIIISGIYLITRPKVLGSMRHTYEEPATNTSEISFRGEKAEKIKFIFESHVKSGTLDMVLYDSKRNEVYHLSQARELETYYVIEDVDTYTLAAECENFTGNYKIKVTN